jgi:hypothetical protein
MPALVFRECWISPGQKIRRAQSFSASGHETPSDLFLYPALAFKRRNNGHVGPIAIARARIHLSHRISAMTKTDDGVERLLSLYPSDGGVSPFLLLRIRDTGYGAGNAQFISTSWILSFRPYLVPRDTVWNLEMWDTAIEFPVRYVMFGEPEQTRARGSDRPVRILKVFFGKGVALWGGPF